MHKHLKIILIAIVFACCTLIAFGVRRYYALRQSFYKDLTSFCSDLKLSIQGSNKKLITIIEECKEKYKGEFCLFLCHYEDYLLNRIPKDEFYLLTKFEYLSTHEKLQICSFFDELGKLTYDEEIEKIVGSERIFQEYGSISTTEQKKYSSLYFKLFVVLGLLVCILFL